MAALYAMKRSRALLLRAGRGLAAAVDGGAALQGGHAAPSALAEASAGRLRCDRRLRCTVEAADHVT